LNKELKLKLYKTAILASPIIAVYGGSPFYIFEKVSLTTYLFLIAGLAINVFIVFWILIISNSWYPSQPKYWRFISTYIANIILRLIFFFIDPIFKDPAQDFTRKYIAYPILTSLALNAIAMIVIDSIVSAYKKNEAEKLVQNLKLENTEAQKQVLMQQLQPHFLFNSLSVLKSLIAEAPEKASSYVVRLSEFLRYAVQTNNVEIIEITKEIQFVKDYIELQKVRFDDSFTYEINIPKEIEQKQVPMLSLQVLVENIFKHNYFTTKNPLHFSISYVDGYLVVSNKIVSIKINPKSETGLANLNKRYQLIADKSIVITKSEDFFEVKIPVLA
jgi:two-component system, LytTR family, sensor kinase